MWLTDGSFLEGIRKGAIFSAGLGFHSWVSLPPDCLLTSLDNSKWIAWRKGEHSKYNAGSISHAGSKNLMLPKRYGALLLRERWSCSFKSVQQVRAEVWITRQKRPRDHQNFYFSLLSYLQKAVIRWFTQNWHKKAFADHNFMFSACFVTAEQ